MSESNNIRKASVLCVIGFTAYWGWLFCVLVVQVIGAPASDLPGNIWLWSTFAHIGTLAVMAALARRAAPYSSNMVVVASSPAFMVGGMGLMLASRVTEPFALMLCGVLLVGVGSAGLLLCWGELYAALCRGGERRGLLFASMAACMVLFLVLAMLPVAVQYALLCAMPVVSLVAVEMGVREIGSLDSPRPMGGDGASRERLTPRFALFCLVYSVPLGYFEIRTSLMGTGLQGWLPVLAPALVLVVAVAGADAFFERKRASSIVPAVVIPATIAGLLLLALFDDARVQVALLLAFVAQQLLTVMLYARFAAIASRGPEPPAAVVAKGVAATDAGFVVGMIVGHFAQTGASSLEFTLGIAYVVVLAGFLVSGSVLRRGDDEAGGARRSDKPSGVDVQRTVSQVAAESGLTPREEEVLGHLLRGKSVTAIAADIFLSKNTVRTHVSHIYQKVGVHTRDELVELVERRS